MPNPLPASGIHRIAAFILSQEPAVAASLIKHLDPSITAEVAEAMTSIESAGIGPEEVDKAYLELARDLHGPKTIRSYDDERLAAILSEAIGADSARKVVESIHTRRIHEQPFLELESEPPERVAWLLRDESPAVCALVLAHLKPALSAAVLSLVEADRVVAIVQRMATLRPPGFEVLRSVCSDLLERLAQAGEVASSGAPGGQLRSIAEMLGFSTADVERTVLEGLQEADADVAAEIREHMFTWEDIAEIDRRSMQKILGTVDTKTLSIALKATSPGVEKNIMDNLSSRVADMVREERELTGPMAMSEVLAAREEVMTNVRGLIETGEFSPSRAGEELVE